MALLRARPQAIVSPGGDPSSARPLKPNSNDADKGWPERGHLHFFIIVGDKLGESQEWSGCAARGWCELWRRSP